MWGAAICSHERRYSPRPEESKQGFPYSWHSRRLWTSCCGRKQNSRTLEKQPSLKCWAISLALKRFDFEKRNPQAFMGLTETVTHLDSGLVNSSLAERAPPTSQGVHSGAPIRAASCAGVLGVLAIQALHSRWQWRLCWGTFQALKNPCHAALPACSLQQAVIISLKRALQLVQALSLSWWMSLHISVAGILILAAAHKLSRTKSDEEIQDWLAPAACHCIVHLPADLYD